MSSRYLAAVAIVAAFSTAGTRAQEPAAASPAEIERGKEVYERWCTPCHGPGIGMPGFDALPGTHQLAIKYRDTDIPAVLAERTDLVPELIKVIVRQGVSFMPHFRKTEISDEDLDAIAAYLTRTDRDP